MLSRVKARMLLAECRGNEIWSLQLCHQKGVPGEWIDELANCFESGFRTDRDTIYENERVTNQYEGLQDLDLAYKLAEFLGVDRPRASELALSREAEVKALQEAVDEL